VRDVAIAERIARPSAAPSCCAVFRSPAASPALSSPTPAFAAVVAPTKTKPTPNAVTSSPGRMFDTYDPSTGIRESQ
jgi:hypothetical protein